MTKTELWNIYHRININNVVERRCTQCGKWLIEDTDNFYLMNKVHPEKGFSAWCKKCSSQKTGIRQKKNYDTIGRPYQQEWRNKDNNREVVNNRVKEWREDNHEHKREYELDYYKGNPDKFKIYTQKHRIHDITKAEQEALFKVFNYSCAYCGCTLEEHKIKFGERLHNDHVDDAGANDLRNDVPACKSCNSLKRMSDMEEWYRQQEFFSEERLDFIKWWITDGYKDYIEVKPPYRIIKKQNDDKKTFHHELWTVDDVRNMIECIDIKSKKKELDLSLIHNIEKTLKKYLKGS